MYNKNYFDKYREANRNKLNEYARNYYKNRILNDPTYKLNLNNKIKLTRHKKIIDFGHQIRKVGRPIKINTM